MRKMPTEQELLKMKMETGKTVQQMVDRMPDKWKSKTIEAAFECLRRGWPLHELNIGAASRELPDM